MDIEVKKSFTLDEGRHEGVIFRIEYREDPHKYTDVYISIDENVEIRASYPTTITDSSMLGELLQRFGAKLEVGRTVNPTKILSGRRCSFLALKKKREGKEYTEVLRETVKPVVIEEKIE